MESVVATGPRIEDALAYVAQGMSVVPLWHGTKISALAKGRIQRYRQHPATRDELERWFAGGQRNIGILTGRASQLLVLDLDGEDGRDFLRTKSIPPTPVVETPSEVPQRGAAVCLRVSPPSGRVVAGRSVCRYNDGHAAATDRGGRFTVAGALAL